MSGTETKAKAANQTGVHLGEVDNCIDCLSKQMGVLREKLAPVSRAHEPPPVTERPSLDSMSPINEEIENLAFRLRIQLESIETMLQHLDI